MPCRRPPSSAAACQPLEPRRLLSATFDPSFGGGDGYTITDAAVGGGVYERDVAGDVGVDSMGRVYIAENRSFSGVSGDATSLGLITRFAIDGSSAPLSGFAPPFARVNAFAVAPDDRVILVGASGMPLMSDPQFTSGVYALAPSGELSPLIGPYVGAQQRLVDALPIPGGPNAGRLLVLGSRPAQGGDAASDLGLWLAGGDGSELPGTYTDIAALVGSQISLNEGRPEVPPRSVDARVSYGSGGNVLVTAQLKYFTDDGEYHEELGTARFRLSGGDDGAAPNFQPDLGFGRRFQPGQALGLLTVTNIKTQVSDEPRISPDGDADDDFVFQPAAAFVAERVTIDGDGRLLFPGRVSIYDTQATSSGPNSEWPKVDFAPAVVRFDAEGRIDTDFGNEGIAYAEIRDPARPASDPLGSNLRGDAQDVHVLADGSLLVVAQVGSRYVLKPTPLDATFIGKGGPAVYRLNDFGFLDPGFAPFSPYGDGYRVVQVAESLSDTAYFGFASTGSAVTPDGKLVLGGDTQIGEYDDFYDDPSGTALEPTAQHYVAARLLIDGDSGGTGGDSGGTGGGMVSATLVRGADGLAVLRVTGTAGDDALALGRDADGNVVVRSADTVVRTFAAGDVDGLELFGGDGADVLRNDLGNAYAGRVTLRGGGGNDTLTGGGLYDRLYGDDGDDLLQAGPFANLLYGGAGGDTLTGNLGRDALYGGDGADLLDGGDRGDLLDGGAGDDLLAGGAGNDTFLGSDGNDALDGGDGTDLLAWAGQGRGVAADLSAGIAGFADGAGDSMTLAGVENLLGGDGDDTLAGDLGRNFLVGGAGDDTLTGRGGKDTLLGGDGRDTLDGGDDTDLLVDRDGPAGDIDGGGGLDRAFVARVGDSSFARVERAYDDLDELLAAL